MNYFIEQLGIRTLENPIQVKWQRKYILRKKRGKLSLAMRYGNSNHLSSTLKRVHKPYKDLALTKLYNIYHKNSTATKFLVTEIPFRGSFFGKMSKMFPSLRAGTFPCLQHGTNQTFYATSLYKKSF